MQWNGRHFKFQETIGSGWMDEYVYIYMSVREERSGIYNIIIMKSNRRC